MSIDRGVNWTRSTDKLPTDSQMCYIAGDGTHLYRIPWSDKMGGWFDFFGTKEAATLVVPEDIAYWCDAGEIWSKTMDYE